MTRIVVMDEELHEALTVVDVPIDFLREVESGKRGRYIRLALDREVEATVYDPARDGTLDLDSHITVFRLEEVRRQRDRLFWYAYALDPTAALRVRAAFLPGQEREVQRREGIAHSRGVMEVLRFIG